MDSEPVVWVRAEGCRPWLPAACLRQCRGDRGWRTGVNEQGIPLTSARWQLLSVMNGHHNVELRVCIPQAPHVVHMRNGVKFGDMQLSDSMLSDGLMDAFQNYHMGITGEEIIHSNAAT